METRGSHSRAQIWNTCKGGFSPYATVCEFDGGPWRLSSAVWPWSSILGPAFVRTRIESRACPGRALQDVLALGCVFDLSLNSPGKMSTPFSAFWYCLAAARGGETFSADLD